MHASGTCILNFDPGLSQDKAFNTDFAMNVYRGPDVHKWDSNMQCKAFTSGMAQSHASSQRPAEFNAVRCKCLHLCAICGSK